MGKATVSITDSKASIDYKLVERIDEKHSIKVKKKGSFLKRKRANFRKLKKRGKKIREEKWTLGLER